MPVNQFENYPLSWQPDKSRIANPIYKSLLQQLEEDIVSGKLQRGSRLPSQRELADYLDINFTTVGQAYRDGISQGFLYTIIGSGTFVSQNAFLPIAISTDNVNEAIIDLGFVSSFDECNHLVVPYIATINQGPFLAERLNYRNPLGTPQELATANQWLSLIGVHAEDEMIATVSGIQNGLTIILMSAFQPGNRIAVDRYTYSNFIELATLLNLEIVPIDSDGLGMNPEMLAMECKKKQIHGIFVMPACNNPLGFQLTLPRRKELVEVIAREKLWVIEDATHSTLTAYFQTTPLPTFQALLPEQTFYLAGMTKFLCSGLHVAYLVFPKQTSTAIKQTIFTVNIKTSGLEAAVVNQLLTSNTAQNIVKEKFLLTKKVNKLFDEIFDLPRPSNPYPYYRTIPIDNQVSQQKVEQELLNRGVRVYHSNRFTPQPDKHAFIRVSLASNSLDKLTTGLKIVKSHLINNNYFKK
jgi:DNA-binding transcriptional MocR family regulator